MEVYFCLCSCIAFRLHETVSLTHVIFFYCFAPETFIVSIQRIQYAKTKSDIIAKADGTFVPRERRKRTDEKCKMLAKTPFFYISCLITDLTMYPYVPML
jgi:hypothetical protein